MSLYAVNLTNTIDYRSVITRAIKSDFPIFKNRCELCPTTVCTPNSELCLNQRLALVGYARYHAVGHKFIPLPTTPVPIFKYLCSGCGDLRAKCKENCKVFVEELWGYTVDQWDISQGIFESFEIHRNHLDPLKHGYFSFKHYNDRKKRQAALRESELMSQWRKGNQKERRHILKAQAAIPHPLRTVPPLPSSYTTYISHCISRDGRHDCSVSCESEIIGLSPTTEYFYVVDKHGFPVELWEEKVNHQPYTLSYNLQWRRTDYKPKSQYNTADYYPTPPPGGKRSKEEFLEPFRVPGNSQRVNNNPTLSPNHSDRGTDPVGSN